MHKETKALLTDEIEALGKEEEDAEETSGEARRGTGKTVTGFNFLFINGCPANSTVMDKNHLVENLGQELRATMKQKHACFPHCLTDLTKRFPGCMI